MSITVKKLSLAYIQSLPDKVDYHVFDTSVTCYLKIGFATIEATAHCYDESENNIELGKQTAYKNAITKLFEFEAYHQKRLRGEKNDS